MDEQNAVRSRRTVTIADAELLIVAALAVAYALFTSASVGVAALFAAVISVYVFTGVTGRRERGVGIGRAYAVALGIVSGVVILWTLFTAVSPLTGLLVVAVLWVAASVAG